MHQLIALVRLLVIVLGSSLTLAVQAATFTVNTTDDTVDAAPNNEICADSLGRCSLRAAIMAANALPGADTITLPAGIYTLTIPGVGESGGATGDLNINGDLTINGAGAASTIVDGARIDRVILVHSGVVTISGLTVRNGLSPGFGGGIQNHGALTLNNVSVSNNEALGDGGGIMNFGGTLTLNGTTVANNDGGGGGGIYTFGGSATLVLENSTMSGNKSLGRSQCGFGGGALWTAQGAVTITNSTIFDNFAICNLGFGGRGDAIAQSHGGTITLRNSIIATPTSGGQDCYTGPLTSLGHNLASDSSCGLTGTGDLNNTDPKLGPLADNGGPTPTHVPLAGSPVVDVVPVSNCPLATDQRGVSRPQGLYCDIGSVEANLTANAGPDQVVNENVLVTLAGSGSGSGTLTYSWSQIAPASPVVSLSDPFIATPTFTAPPLPGGFGSQTFTLQLTVTSGAASAVDTVNIQVNNVNHAPTAQASVVGATTLPAPVNEGSSVTLDSSASFDSDGDTITHTWVQTGFGDLPPVSLTGPADKPTFIAPLLAGGANNSTATLTFQVTVTDGSLSSTDSVSVRVQQVNGAPVANAGLPIMVDEGTAGVTLNGSASDPDGDAITSYTWTQVSGPAVALANATTPTPSFTAPATGPGGAVLEFDLVVSDGAASSQPSRARVNVRNVNDPPNCGDGRASVSELWPPNHKMVSVGIVGVTDPSSSTITIGINAVTQDEPVNGLGDGDTSPDAVIQPGSVLLRAERSAIGNGRVYRIAYTASNNSTGGGSCTGVATVVVKKSQKPGEVAYDDGQIYVSTEP